VRFTSSSIVGASIEKSATSAMTLHAAIDRACELIKSPQWVAPRDIALLISRHRLCDFHVPLGNIAIAALRCVER
jgi:hypothetical protein